MEPSESTPDRPPRRAAPLLAPLALLLAVGGPVGVLAAQSPAPRQQAAPAPSAVIPSPSPTATPSPAATPRPTAAPGRTSKSAFSLKPGDCLPVAPPETASVTVVVLPCTQLHEAEVFAVFALPGPPGVGFPGEAIATSQAAEGCERRFSDYVGLAYGKSAYDYFFYKPDQKTWTALRDRTVTCILTSPPRGVSAKDSRT